MKVVDEVGVQINKLMVDFNVMNLAVHEKIYKKINEMMVLLSQRLLVRKKKIKT